MASWLNFLAEVVRLAHSVAKGGHLMSADEAAMHIRDQRAEVIRRREMFDRD